MKQLDVPKLIQTYKWDCGAKALQATLAYYGIYIRESKLIKYAKTNAKKGTSKLNMLLTLKRFKLKTEAKAMTLKDLKKYIDKEIPVIILLQAWKKRGPEYVDNFKEGHWVIAIGYDKTKIIFEDPYHFQRTFLTNKELDERWHAQENKTKIFNYGIAVFGEKREPSINKILHMD
ncbi:MAG: cysteine peptidase family C39 domain-containing protein [Candidatus Nanoarchaeia archaeon]|nr:cysteine peptidase family C39 domain-containing protein [Candidatus Nanoarchaeia archaeon]